MSSCRNEVTTRRLLKDLLLSVLPYHPDKNLEVKKERLNMVQITFENSIS